MGLESEGWRKLNHVLFGLKVTRISAGFGDWKVTEERRIKIADDLIKVDTYRT